MAKAKRASGPAEHAARPGPGRAGLLGLSSSDPAADQSPAGHGNEPSPSVGSDLGLCQECWEDLCGVSMMFAIFGHEQPTLAEYLLIDWRAPQPPLARDGKAAEPRHGASSACPASRGGGGEFGLGEGS